MTVNSILSGLDEVEEIVLFKSKKTLAIPASTQELEFTVPHNLGLTPYFEYKISPDAGTTWYIPHELLTFGGNNNTFIQMYTDATNVHIVYSYSAASPPASVRSFVIEYKLYITETTK